jgi:hypothetical protein
VPFIEIALRRGIISNEQFGELIKNLEEIARMLTGLIKGAEKRNV